SRLRRRDRRPGAPPGADQRVEAAPGRAGAEGIAACVRPRAAVSDQQWLQGLGPAGTPVVPNENAARRRRLRSGGNDGLLVVVQRGLVARKRIEFAQYGRVIRPVAGEERMVRLVLLQHAAGV